MFWDNLRGAAEGPTVGLFDGSADGKAEGSRVDE